MATYYARSTGNINGSIWSTTPAGAAGIYYPFSSADILIANSFTVTINVNVTAQELRNDTTGGATSGGTYVLTDGVTVTASALSGATQAIYSSINTPITVNLVGNLVGGSATSIHGMIVSHGGSTLNITGNLVGGSGGNSPNAIFAPALGVLNIVGNVTGGSANLSNALDVSGSTNPSISITGNVTGGVGVNSRGLWLRSNGTVLINGTVKGNTASGILIAGGPSTTTVNGDVSGSDVSTGAPGITIDSININTLYINGTSAGGLRSVGVLNNANGIAFIKRAKGNIFPSASAVSAVGVASSQTTPTYIDEVEYGDYGQSPTSGPVILRDLSTNLITLSKGTSKKTLIDPTTISDYPLPLNVRKDVKYAFGGLTGTCNIPNFNNVSVDTGVDNKVGISVLTQDNVVDALESFSLGRLKRCATVESTGQQLSEYTGT